MTDKDDKDSRDRLNRMTDWPEKIIILDNFGRPRPTKKKVVDPGTKPEGADSEDEIRNDAPDSN
jgi:hypothetical protein